MRFQQIYDWIEANKPATILEIGTWNGHNAARMMKEGAKRYIGFDVWEEGDEILDEVENNAKKRVTMESVAEVLKDFDIELVKGNSRETLPEYIKGKKPFVDMALIDGGHSKGTIKNDLISVLSLMKPNGVIFLDDYYFGCEAPGMGAQSLMGEIQLPYTVLPKAEKTRDGYLVKIIRIDMREVPKPNAWDIDEKIAWKFSPDIAA